MKGHLTERELIEYQFKLASEGLAERMAGHLQECGKCRESLERLKQKFAALDLLREDFEVSEDLISQVLEQVSEPVKSKVVSFRRPAWIGAAAAVLLVGSLLLVAQLRKSSGPARESVRGPIARQDVAQPAPAYKPLPMERKPFGKAAKDEGRGAVEGLAGVRKRGLAEEQIPEQPPFAPASAIELVVLPRRENVQITIYNSADLTLVRERRNLTLKKGWNWLQFMWANTLIDPTSLHLEPLEQRDKIDIQQLVFPARLRELGRWLIRSEVGGQVPFEITYFTSGLSWRAFYMGTLSADEQKMKLQGYVRVANNSGEDYENAQTRLIVGQVHILDEIAKLARRQYPYGSPLPRAAGIGGRDYAWGLREEDREKVPLLGDELLVGGLFRDAKRFHRKEIRKEGLSEYFLYTIEGTETIPDKWGKRLLSFEEDEIEVKSLYKYDEERYGQQTIRFVSFANDEEHNLGKTPIPNGDVKIYGLADREGHLSYVGGTGIKYIPVDEEVELNLGPARLVEVEPTLMGFKTANYVFDRNKDIAGWDEIRTWKIEITNTRTLAVEIEITRSFGTAYWSLKANIPYEKHDVTHARFKLTVEPRSKRTFDYTVTTYRGVREEALTE
ncbi:MAG TPA: DUF4139 domain-containing protein [Sedimentisphaerales bacterium]|nr:DUF4139 domain-containing protein [Sedimentisphaerales bacterium]